MSSGNWKLSGRIEEVIRNFIEANNKKSAKSEEVYGKLSFICYIIIFYSMLFMPVRKEHI
jgi:glycopeptide antibiotics resistance protein